MQRKAFSIGEFFCCKGVGHGIKGGSLSLGRENALRMVAHLVALSLEEGGGCLGGDLDMKGD